MQMKRRKNGGYYDNRLLDRGLLMESAPHSKLYSKISPPLTMTHSSSCGGGSSVGNGGFGHIEHTVSKFDTLAGVAIKYGVEVADIRRMNGLTTDLQMFARKSLQIPLPGRHPPSPIMSNGYHTEGQTSSETMLPNRRYVEWIMFPLQMRKELVLMCGMDNVSVANEKGAGSDKSIEKLVRRRKSEVGLKNHTPDMLLKQDNSGSSGVLSAAAGKGIALRPKAANQTTTEFEAGLPNMFTVGSRDSSMAHAFSGVRKSSSAPNFQHSETNNNNNCPSSSSIWQRAMLNLTTDLQALSTAAITSSIFDGLPKPISSRKNKTALD